MERIKQAYLLWREINNNFHKKSRHTLGRKIDAVFIEILELVFTAGYLSKDKKLPFVQKAVVRADTLKFFLRIAWEVKDMDTKKYTALSEPLDDIGRMLGGWVRNIESRTSSAAISAAE